MKTFASYDEFRNEQLNVINFHKNVNETIISLLKKTGDVTIPEELEEDFKFNFLGFDEIYTINFISNEDENFYLYATSESGDRYIFDFSNINNDMIIEETILSYLFDLVGNK